METLKMMFYCMILGLAGVLAYIANGFYRVAERLAKWATEKFEAIPGQE